MLLFQNASFQKLYFLSALSLVISVLSSKFSVWECIVPVPSCTVQLLPQQGDTSCLFLLFFILVLSSSVLSFFCLFLPVLFQNPHFPMHRSCAPAPLLSSSCRNRVTRLVSYCSFLYCPLYFLSFLPIASFLCSCTFLYFPLYFLFLYCPAPAATGWHVLSLIGNISRPVRWNDGNFQAELSSQKYNSHRYKNFNFGREDKIQKFQIWKERKNTKISTLEGKKEERGQNNEGLDKKQGEHIYVIKYRYYRKINERYII